MQRSEYAQLVRKGAPGSQAAQGPELGMRVRTPLPNSSDACIGGYVGYGMDFAEFGLGARLSACTSGFDNGALHATTNGYDLELRAYRAWDLSALSLAVGIAGGLALFSQSFRFAGAAPARRSAAPFLELAAGVALDLGSGVSAGFDLAAETYFLHLQATGIEPATTRVSFALRSSFGLSKRF